MAAAIPRCFTSSIRAIALSPRFVSHPPSSLRLSRAFSFTSFRAMANTSESAAERSGTSHEHPHQQRAKEQHSEGHNAWKTRPPYAIPNEDDGFEAKYNASCHCGKVEYQLSRERPLDSKLCHCGTCQTQHGELSLLRQTQFTL